MTFQNWPWVLIIPLSIFFRSLPSQNYHQPQASEMSHQIEPLTKSDDMQSSSQIALPWHPCNHQPRLFQHERAQNQLIHLAVATG